MDDFQPMDFYLLKFPVQRGSYFIVFIINMQITTHKLNCLKIISSFSLATHLINPKFVPRLCFLLIIAECLVVIDIINHKSTNLNKSKIQTNTDKPALVTTSIKQ